MLTYHMRLARLSLAGTPVVSALLVGGIALGVGVATAAIAVDHALSRDPLPGRSEQLYYVRLDSWDPNKESPHTNGIPTQITWRDWKAINRAESPVRRSATYKTRLFVSNPARPEELPAEHNVRLVEADFFAMFDAPLRDGGGWAASADAEAEPVVVIGAELADSLFGANAIGQSLRLRDRDFTVVGVLDRWRPGFKVYDPTQNPFDELDQIFIPITHAPAMELRSTGNRDGWKSIECEGFVGCLEASEDVFLQYWVELPDEAARRNYEEFLTAYVLEQKRLGRFERPLRIEVTQLMPLFVELGLRPPQVRAIAVIATLFMVVCAVNLVGLFLGKFLARSAVVGVRRALGASRAQIFAQHLVEAGLVGLGAAALGLGLAAALLAGVRKGIAPIVGDPNLFRLDATMVLAAFGLAAVAALIAGGYPAWRICRIAPANHLKLQ